MTRLALTGGAYQARSVIASAQRCLNLIAEPMPQAQGEPSQYAYYPTPGLRLLGTLPTGPVRALKQVTTGGVYAVGGDTVYSLNPTTWAATALGTITTGLTTPVSMQDNGLDLVIVDGSAGGWDVTLATNAFAAISDPAFYGADRVEYLDTYLLFNKPGTPQFYSSDSLATTFDSLYFANKESFSDLLITLAVAKREIWLLGERTTEVWYNVGGTDFPFQQIQGTFIDQGCAAKYSVATYDNGIYWLGYNRAGQGVVIHGAGYQAARVSTYAIEAELTTYSRIDDAVGFTYFLGGHPYYVLTFPTADRTWVFDIGTQQWHEWAWLDSSSQEHRSRANCAYAVNGTVVAGDWQNGNLYALDPAAYTDNGQPIKRQRSYVHILNDAKRVFYREFIADIETGTSGTPTLPVRIIRSFFDAPDATKLQDYSSIEDTGLPWVPVTGSDLVIFNQQLVAYGGVNYYRPSMLPPDADYAIVFYAMPTTYDTIVTATSLMAVGRAAADLGAGYHVRLSASGGQYTIQLTVIGTAQVYTVGLGTLLRGSYIVSLTMSGSSIQVIIERSDDGMFVNASGVWVTDWQTPAISITDTTWTTAGIPLIGIECTSPWGPVFMEHEDEASIWKLEDGSGYWKWYDAGTMPDMLAMDTVSVTTIPHPYQLWLDWSDDRGHTYGNPVGSSFGGVGEYLTSVQYQRLGYARDRLFRLTWYSPTPTALQGAFIEADTSAKT